MSAESQRCILVVDDEADVRSYLRMALEDAGFRVVTASDGFEALEALRRELPDLISLDLVMPRHSGVKFYRDLKKNKVWAKVPVLIVTGHARDELGKADFEEMIMSGPGVYLEKPVTPGSYVATVCRMLGMEPHAEVGPDSDKLKGELSRAMEGADPEALKRALEALKKKKG